jgi:hypothetical protein
MVPLVGTGAFTGAQAGLMHGPEGEVMEARMNTSVEVRGVAGGVAQGPLPMDRRGFLCAGVAAALAIPVLGIATQAQATGAGDQAVVVLVLTASDPDVGVGGWVDTAGGGRYDVADGVLALPGTVGQSLDVTVYRDDGCTRQLTLVFHPQTTVVEVGAC